MRGGRARLAALLLAGLAGCGVASTSTSSISYPAGPSLAEFRVRERCAEQDPSCQDRARTVLKGILGTLGGPADNPALRSPNDPPPPGRLLITFDAQPPFGFRTFDGEIRSTERVVVDVTAAMRGGPAYAVSGHDLAYEIDAEQAEELLFSLFVLTD